MFSKMLDLLIPRFTVDNIALIERPECYEMIGRVEDMADHEFYTHTCKFRCFNLFGKALFPKQLGQPIKK